MSYQTNLPIGSERFSQTVWKAPNGDLWTGRTGEYSNLSDGIRQSVSSPVALTRVWAGTQDQYEAQSEIEPGTIVFIEEEFIVGEVYSVRVFDVDNIEFYIIGMYQGGSTDFVGSYNPIYFQEEM